MAAEYTVGNSAFLQTLVCYLFRCKLHAPFLPMSKLHVLSAANCRKAQDGSVPRRFPLAPWVLLPDGSQPRRFRWQLRPTYTRIHPSVGHLVGVGNGQQVWVWSLGHVAQLWDRWGRPPHQQDASRDAISLRFPLVDFILDSVETQVSSLGAQAASPCDKVEAAAGGAPRSHASERAAAAASLPCEDNAAVRTKDKPFVLTPRTHMGIFEENGTSLVLHWRGCVAEGDKPPKAKKPNGKNGCSGKQIACKSALKCCKKHIEIPFGLIQTKLYFFPRKRIWWYKEEKNINFLKLLKF